MRLVVTSDWHADWKTLGVSRYNEVRAAVAQSVDYAIRIRAGAYLFGGDLADPDNGGATLTAQALAVEAALRLSEAGIPSIWLRGNHDACEDGSGACVLAPLRPLQLSTKNVFVADHVRVVWLASDLTVLCLPFMPASHGVDVALEAETLWPKMHVDARGGVVDAPPRVVVLSHLTVPGVEPGEETHEMPRGREVLYPFAQTTRAAARVQGHYHKRQVFDPKDGGPRMIIPGSLARLTFGEEDHAPAFVVLDA